MPNSEVFSVMEVCATVGISNQDFTQQLGISVVNLRNQEHASNNTFSDTLQQPDGNGQNLNEFEPDVGIENHCTDSHASVDQHSVENLSDFLSNMDGSADAERCEAEIDAAVRSLKTNLILSLVFVAITSCMSFMADNVVFVIISLLKGITPIVTAVVNFGKLQVVVRLYWAKYCSN